MPSPLCPQNLAPAHKVAVDIIRRAQETLPALHSRGFGLPRSWRAAGAAQGDEAALDIPLGRVEQARRRLEDALRRLTDEHRKPRPGFDLQPPESSARNRSRRTSCLRSPAPGLNIPAGVPRAQRTGIFHTAGLVRWLWPADVDRGLYRLRVQADHPGRRRRVSSSTSRSWRRCGGCNCDQILRAQQR